LAGGVISNKQGLLIKLGCPVIGKLRNKSHKSTVQDWLAKQRPGIWHLVGFLGHTCPVQNLDLPNHVEAVRRPSHPSSA